MSKLTELVSKEDGLLNFIMPSERQLRILVVDSLGYLPRLRKMLPEAEIFACTPDREKSELSEYAGLDVQWEIMDYHQEILPFPMEYFDIIMSDFLLESVENPQDIAAGFSRYIKETGSLLTSFRNIRFWKVIQEMMEGHYYSVVSRLYARPEYERLLYASFYKECHSRAIQRKGPEELIDSLETCGFSGRQDLETEFWIVKADRSTPEIGALKSFFTREQRKNLSRLLHRIEYDVETEKSVESFWRLYEEMGLFPEYLGAYVYETVVHRANFIENLRNFTSKDRMSLLDELEPLVESPWG